MVSMDESVSVEQELPRDHACASFLLGGADCPPVLAVAKLTTFKSLGPVESVQLLL